MEDKDYRKKEVEAISWRLTKTEKLLITVQYVFVLFYCIWSYTGAYNFDAKIGRIPANILQSWLWGLFACVITLWFSYKMYKEIRNKAEEV